MLSRDLVLSGIEDHVVNSEWERKVKKVFAVIRDTGGDGWIARRDLTRKTPKLRPDERDDVVKTLLEAQRIEEAGTDQDQDQGSVPGSRLQLAAVGGGGGPAPARRRISQAWAVRLTYSLTYFGRKTVAFTAR